MRWIVSLEDVAPGPELDDADARAYGLVTGRGTVEIRHYATPQPRAGVICVGGAGGGWDTPAAGLYPRLCRALQVEGIDAVRVRFRNVRSLEGCSFDVLAGLSFLETRGIDCFGLVGHSMGGAVIIQAAARCEAVRAIVSISTQSYGAHPVRNLAPRCACLFLHGGHDRILPPACSESVYAMAGEPKRLRLFPGGDHGLDGVADGVFTEAHDWLVEHLAQAERQGKAAP